MLRQGIRDDKPLAYGYKDSWYILFNTLGCDVAHIIAGSSSHVRPDIKKANAAFRAILDVRSEDWEKALKDFPEKSP